MDTLVVNNKNGWRFHLNNFQLTNTHSELSEETQLGKRISRPEPQATPESMACRRGEPVSNASNHPAQVRE
jgi:hypothetical protein